MGLVLPLSSQGPRGCVTGDPGSAECLMTWIHMGQRSLDMAMQIPNPKWHNVTKNSRELFTETGSTFEPGWQIHNTKAPWSWQTGTSQASLRPGCVARCKCQRAQCHADICNAPQSLTHVWSASPGVAAVSAVFRLVSCWMHCVLRNKP